MTSLLAGLTACGSSGSPYEPAGTTTGAAGMSAGGSTGGSSSSGDNLTGATGGSTGDATAGGTGGGTTGPKQQLGVTLEGDLAFPVLFTGEFYGTLPDGGADLSNCDCRIADGTDLGALCGTGQATIADAGYVTSRQILDIYVTSVAANPLTFGTAAVSTEYGDGGEFATIELTLCNDGGGWDFERASVGQVDYQATESGMFGEFQAQFDGYGDGGGVLSGTFGAGYCGTLNGY